LPIPLAPAPRFGHTIGMRLFPRSRRGNWLLAGAVWCAACAGLWWALPVVPRAVMRLPEEFALIGFGPDGRTGLAVHSHSTPAFSDDRRNDTIELLEIPTGQPRVTLCRDCRQVQVIGRSADRQRWLLFEEWGSESRYHFLDLEVPKARTFNWAELPAPIKRGTPLCVSSNGQFCALDWVGRGGGLETGFTIWDVVNNRVHASFTGIGRPAAFSQDSHSFAAIVDGEPHSVRVYDLRNLQARGTFRFLGTSQLASLWLSEHGSFVAGRYERDLICGELATGEIRARQRGFLAHFAPGEEVLLTVQSSIDQPDDNIASWNDCSTELCRHQESFERIEDIDQINASNNGRLVVIRHSGSHGVLGEICSRLGMASFLLDPTQECRGAIFDAQTGSKLGEIPFMCGWRDDPRRYSPFETLDWSPDDKTLLTLRPGTLSTWEIWDIPPRKSLMWFAAGAALLALPIALLAWRRTRKLRAA
jgi:hypothetical protein